MLVGGCRHNSSQPRHTSLRIAVGGQTQLVYLPLTLAQQLGYYQQEGLDVQITDLAGGAKALEALLSGSVDVVCGYFDHVIQMRAEGKKLTAFLLMQRFPGLALVVSPATARQIHRVEDLSGAVVGVSAPGSSTSFFLRYLLHQVGMDAAQLAETGIGMGASAIAAMQFGKVDAAVLAEPAISILARRKGPLRILADTRTEQGARAVYGSSYYPAAVLYSHQNWLKENGPIARAVARALLRTLQWMQNHSPEEIARAMPETFRGEDLTLYIETVRSALPMFEPSGRMPRDGPARVRQLLSLLLDKVGQATIDEAETFSDEWLPQPFASP